MKILVIDDEKPTLSMFRLFLAAYGYEVHTASDGEEGLAAFKALEPDIVFTDIRMPGMDGLEVLAQIRAADPACQVIVITGHGDMDRALDAMDMDASDFINKPVERQALNSALIRAEKRAAASPNMPFDLAKAPEGEPGAWSVKGRMTEEARLDPILGEAGGDSSIVLEFDSRFSIDRSGLTRLTRLLQQVAEKESRVELKGLSLNYIRLFEMAGLQKLARIHPAKIEEPGL